MTYRRTPYLFCMTLAGYLLLCAAPAAATQTHGGAEGLIAHQLAHLFYLVSMGILVYWLRKRQLVSRSGWRLIQFAALFLILWNINAFFVHLLDETPGLIRSERVGTWEIYITTRPGLEPLAGIYYLAKLDHLLCVPALLCLYLGLKRLTRERRDTGGDGI